MAPGGEGRPPAIIPDPTATGGDASSEDGDEASESRLREGVTAVGTDPVECCLLRPGVIDLRGAVGGIELSVLGVMF